MLYFTQPALPNYIDKPLIPITEIIKEKDKLTLTKEIAGQNWQLVWAIGSLESANYTSRLCILNNNCWGRKSRDGGYESWSTFEEGLQNQVAYLERKYFSQGLTTPEAINPVYAEDPNWHLKVQTIIDKL